MLNLAFLNFFFFFNDTATTEIYTLSLHDALPIWLRVSPSRPVAQKSQRIAQPAWLERQTVNRSEEHTSELQSQSNLVCRLLLEKKKKKKLSQIQSTHHEPIHTCQHASSI